jgi:hypothetical protein
MARPRRTSENRPMMDTSKPPMSAFRTSVRCTLSPGHPATIFRAPRRLSFRGNVCAWIAVSVYVLVAIVRKRLGLEASLYQILHF